MINNSTSYTSFLNQAMKEAQIGAQFNKNNNQSQMIAKSSGAVRTELENAAPTISKAELENMKNGAKETMSGAAVAEQARKAMTRALEQETQRQQANAPKEEAQPQQTNNRRVATDADNIRISPEAQQKQRAEQGNQNQPAPENQARDVLARSKGITKNEEIRMSLEAAAAQRQAEKDQMMKQTIARGEAQALSMRREQDANVQEKAQERKQQAAEASIKVDVTA